MWEQAEVAQDVWRHTVLTLSSNDQLISAAFSQDADLRETQKSSDMEEMSELYIVMDHLHH